MLPIFAAVTSLGIFESSDLLRGAGFARAGRLVAGALVAATLAVVTFNYVFVAWGGSPEIAGVASALGAPVDSDDETCRNRMFVAFCPNAPEVGYWAIDDVIDRVVQEGDCENSTCRMTFQYDLFPYRYYLERCLSIGCA